VVVWVVNDETKKGSETLESFKQAILFKDMGWNVHDTMIYRKINPLPNAGNRYQQCFEYMFVFSKGKPKTTNIQMRERINNSGDKRTYRKKSFSRKPDGTFEKRDYYIKNYVPKDNIFDYYVGGGHSTKDKIAFEAKIAQIDDLENFYGHIEVDAQNETYSDENDNFPNIEQKANFYLGNNIKIVNGSKIV
jgi:site-specific DNA-methyltransferase (adenine-specific)